ncbi:nucleoside-diphosphate-sugar epimerase [Nonlabens xylanidelens]|uniref:Nucleoside-diphosphate-sugar epimerase n=1 Tax=Nonlabens xylanidelens TaxID=191564 RepID=A0A2S6IS23_9FLAO|nr:NAD-dependent epimerase/dehydratase family protein [Nonlabens xylanidelens]PPK96981.1 nucleoside-diphosphate-sugar epimerase [Nonlabens xylanidelens]PQJ13674.1 nucleoside-diphosphate sugar epimerase [Nonlabens xylanidelens]
MILITGATGLVGGHLLYRFRESGNNIIALYRDLKTLDNTREIFESYEKGASVQVDNFQWLQADILEIPSLEKAMENITTVYHCAAAIDGLDFEHLKSINMRGTENVINVAIARGVSKLCHVSSIAALGESVGGRAVNEDDYFNLDGLNTDYAITKFGAEMEAWRATQENLEVVIVNPGVILGEGNWNSGSGQLFSKTASGNSFYTDGSSGFVDVRDVAKAMQELTESDYTNERVILVSENKSYKDVLAYIAISLNKKKPSIKLSKSLLTAVSYLLKIPNLLGLKRKLSTATVNSLSSNTKYSNENAKTVLSFDFISVAESIERVCKFYNERKH